MNEVVTLTEALGSPDQKTTHYFYNSFGFKEKVLKPDGVELIYEYNCLGQHTKLKSSDYSIDEEYHYDVNGNMIKCFDHIHQLETLRQFNQNNELIHEELGNGLNIHIERDCINRPTHIHLPDGSIATYEYNATYLKSIKYNGYTHHYTEYDQSGQILKQDLMGKAGSITHEYDPSHRIKNIYSKHWAEENIQYNSVGNLTKHIIKTPFISALNEYQYDPLYQLTDESGFQKHNYKYDSLQNRREKDTTEYTVNDCNELTSQGLFEYTYDPN